MKLTKRATEFFQKQSYRKDAVQSLAVIEHAFSKIGIKATPELIDFQLSYGGLIIDAGLEPICFGILHGEAARGEFKRSSGGMHELIYWPADDDIPIDHFSCADTLYQEYFTIDLQGGYYEGWELVATKFDSVIEDLALFQEIKQLGYQYSYTEYFENLQLNFERIKNDLALINYPDFPQDIIKWANNEEIVLKLSHKKISLFSKRELSIEQKNYLRRLTNKKELQVNLSLVETNNKLSFWAKLKKRWSKK